MSDKQYTYDYPMPALTADIVVFGFDGWQLHILLIERKLEPYKGMWALPGGFMHIDETIEKCAARELAEETGVRGAYLRQFGVFSDVTRDPRGRVVTIAFLALINKSDYRLIAGDDAARAEWFDLDRLPPLAFDHSDIVAVGRQRLRDLIATRPVVLKLLDKRFSIAELQRLVETITGETYDRRNFQRRLLQSGLLQDEGPVSEPGSTRPAHSYSLALPEEDEDSIGTCAEDCESEDLNFNAADLMNSVHQVGSKPSEGTAQANSTSKRLSKAARQGLNFFKF